MEHNKNEEKDYNTEKRGQKLLFLWLTVRDRRIKSEEIHKECMTPESSREKCTRGMEQCVLCVTKMASDSSPSDTSPTPWRGSFARHHVREGQLNLGLASAWVGFVSRFPSAEIPE